MVDNRSPKALIEDFLAALERELEGYKFRLKVLAEGEFDRLSKSELGERVKAVVAEIKRVKALLTGDE